MTDDIGMLPGGRMGVADAATYLGLSTSYMAQLRSKGDGPKYIQPAGPAGKVFYYKDDLDEWLRGRQNTND